MCLLFAQEVGRSALCKLCKLISWLQRSVAAAGGMRPWGWKWAYGSVNKQTRALLRWTSEKKQYKIWNSRCNLQTLTWRRSSSTIEDFSNVNIEVVVCCVFRAGSNSITVGSPSLQRAGGAVRVKCSHFDVVSHWVLFSLQGEWRGP